MRACGVRTVEKMTGPFSALKVCPLKYSIYLCFNIVYTVRDEINAQHFEFALCRHLLYHYAYPPPSRWSYGLLGSLGRRHAQTPCDLGLTRPRNVHCHQGQWSWSWPVWPLLEVYRVENSIMQETELGEFLSHIVGGVCVFGLRLGGRMECVPPPKRKPNATTPWGI